MRVRAGAAIVSLIAGVMVLVAAPPASAGVVINVPASQPTIQAAIDAASAGDTVLVAPGAYFEHIDFKGKAIEVKSSAGPATTIIDGGAPTASPPSRPVKRGRRCCAGSRSPTAGRFPAAVASTSSGRLPTIVGNIITGNNGEVRTGRGLGVYVGSGSPLIEGNQILDNFGGSTGGGIYGDKGASPEIVGNLIKGHSAYFGAGVYISGGILRNVIRDNHASSFGGVGTEGSVTLVNNLIVDNTADAVAGGVGWAAVTSGTATFVNNTIAGNQAPEGAALAVGSAGLTLVNNVLAGAGGGNLITCLNDAPATVFDHTDIYPVSPAAFVGCADPTGANGNISLDPSFAADYTLRVGSPAIDAGRAAPSVPATDQAGNPRPTDGDGDGGAVVDMGAFETPTLTPEVINVPASMPTIQAGIDAASEGDTVVVGPGTYAERIDFKGKAIEVKSSAGPATTIIDGGGLPNVVTFKTNEIRASVLRGFTVTGGVGELYGIGVLIDHASPTLVGNVITGNRSPVGSGAGIGLAVRSGSPLIKENEIVGNPGGSIGGGILLEHGNPEIVGNLIGGHSAHFGAGVVIGSGVCATTSSATTMPVRSVAASSRSPASR